MAAGKYKYIGPADTFIVGGKEYHKGDEIPLSKESLNHHRKFGHTFEGDDLEDVSLIPDAPNPVPPPAFGDSGEVISETPVTPVSTGTGFVAGGKE